MHSPSPLQRTTGSSTNPLLLAKKQRKLTLRLFSLIDGNKMRSAIRNTFLIAVIFATVAAPAESKWRRVSSMKIDWDNHADVEISLSIPVDWNDPGDFTRISIGVPGQEELTFTNDEGWVKYRSPEASVSPQIKKSNNVI